MTKCNICKAESEYPIGYKRTFCDSCVADKEIGFPSSIEKVFIKGYGWESKKRIEEMDRRVILPDNRPNSEGGYYLGRRSESGRITDQTPSY